MLILDEPTNDLDTTTLAILEDYLDSYEGIVIAVSHDRYFLDRVARRIFAFEAGGTLRQYEGGYTDYVNRLAEQGLTPTESWGRISGEGAGSAGPGRRDAAAQNGGTAAPGIREEKRDARATWKHEKIGRAHV